MCISLAYHESQDERLQGSKAVALYTLLSNGSMTGRIKPYLSTFIVVQVCRATWTGSDQRTEKSASLIELDGM